VGRDNSPKIRQTSKLQRKQGNRPSYDRILIVSEGTKTEPNYFREIRQDFRIPTINVQIQPSDWGTDPLNIVKYAEHLFSNGDTHRRITKKSFERIYVVFDRDDHTTYHAALQKSESLNNKLRNDQKQKVQFIAITSIPCFELWLLLHFKEIYDWLHRDDVIRHLKSYIPNYEKGLDKCYQKTRHNIEIAIERAKKLSNNKSIYNDNEAYTNMYALIEFLLHSKQ
jgi:hypothetical protein